MTYLSLTQPALQSKLWTNDNSLLKQTIYFIFGVLVLAFAAQISIPLEPVPLTFQSATVVLIGMAYGAKRGAAVIAAYLLLGASGAPVFANFHAGLPVFFNTTGGYLLGFLPAAFISGFLAQIGFAKKIASSFIAAVIGASIIFLFGVGVLSTFVGADQAIALGLMPFVVTELVKLAAVAVLAPQMWKQS